jgi:probable rRNA maturation factor
VLRELLRYLIHGLLHLAGYTDEQELERQQMEREQETIVQRVWSEFSMDEIAK